MLLEKDSPKNCFPVNFAKLLRTSFDRTYPMTASCVYLRILRSFSNHLFYRAHLGNYLFHVQVAEFPPDTVKIYFTGDFHLLKIDENYL